MPLRASRMPYATHGVRSPTRGGLPSSTAVSTTASSIVSAGERASPPAQVNRGSRMEASAAPAGPRPAIRSAA